MRSRLPPSRIPPAVGLAVLLIAALGAAVGPVAAADARLTLTETTVTPDTPTVGAPITAETTLRFSAGSNTSMTVDEVRVVDPQADGEVLGTATELGRLSPGETLDVPVTFTVNESGAHDLRLVAVGTDVDGETVRATRPLTVGVERGAPQVEVETDGLVTETDSPIEATVSNPTTAPLRGVEVAVTSGEGSRATIASLPAGTAQTVNLTAALPEAGEGTLELTTTYTTPTGVERESRTNKTVTVEGLSADVGLRAERARSDDSQQQGSDLAGLVGGGGTDALQSQSDDGSVSSAARVDVTVTNFGNAPIEDVVLRAEDTEGARLGTVGRFAAAETLAAGESETVTVDLSGVSADGVRFVAGYETPAGSTESALVYGYDAERGQAAFTGVDVTLREGGRVAVDGNLANVGDGAVESAVVSIRPTSGVNPAYPQRDYFVGTVEASSFAPFELTAQADMANASQLAVQVQYTVDGEQVSDNTTVPLPPAESSGGGGFPAGTVGGILLGVIGIAAATLYATRYRDR